MKWLFAAFLVFGSVALTAEEKEEIHHVKIELELYCPPSAELEDLIDTINSKEDEQLTDYYEWVSNLRQGMKQLNALLDSEEIYRGGVHFNHEITDTVPE